MRRNEVQGVAFPSVDIPKCGVTDADCLLQHGCKHPLKITGGTTNNLKHVRCGSLLLQSLCEVRSALPQFVEQPRVLDGNDRLGGEVFDITFSPDERKLYVIDTGITEGQGNPAWIRVFDVDIDAGKVSNGRVFANDFAPGFTDGMRCDADGNVWCSMGWADPKDDGVFCYSPEGQLLGKIHVPETVANLTFGGMRRNRLYICGSTSLYACYTSATGAMKP